MNLLDACAASQAASFVRRGVQTPTARTCLTGDGRSDDGYIPVVVDSSEPDHVERRPGASRAAISKAEQSLDCKLPDDYVRFLGRSNGLSGWMKGSPIELWPVEGLATCNSESPSYGDGIVLIGSDGCGNVVALDLSARPSSVLAFPWIGGPEPIVPRPMTVASWNCCRTAGGGSATRDRHEESLLESRGRERCAQFRRGILCRRFAYLCGVGTPLRRDYSVSRKAIVRCWLRTRAFPTVTNVGAERAGEAAARGCSTVLVAWHYPHDRDLLA